jgi:hypothetical protein
VPLEGEWEGRGFTGSLDVLLRSKDGREVVLDLKWGAKTYRELLENGWALQLAVYSAARQLSTNALAPPQSAYYSIAGGTLLATDAARLFNVSPRKGDAVSTAWDKAQRTLPMIEDALARGHIPVTGVSQSPGLLKALRQREADRAAMLEFDAETNCRHCKRQVLCGKHGEVV